MLTRAAALLLTGPSGPDLAPAGVDPAQLTAALAEDVVDALAGLADVEVVLACDPARVELAEAIRWPGMHRLELAAGAGPVAALDGLHQLGYDVGAVVAADAPDLPGLVLAKPFSALSSAAAAVAPAPGGGITVLAARLPVPAWLRALAPLDLADLDPVERLQAAAPRRRDVRATPSWHRMRTAADLGRLDPELEGWERTRALLAGLAPIRPHGR